MYELQVSYKLGIKLLKHNNIIYAFVHLKYIKNTLAITINALVTSIKRQIIIQI